MEIPPGVPSFPDGSRLEQIDKTLEAIRDLQKPLEASEEAKTEAEVAKTVSRARWLKLTARGGRFVVRR